MIKLYKQDKQFYHGVVSAIHKINSENRYPISVAELMQRKIDAIKSGNPTPRRGVDDPCYVHIPYCTGDAIIYHPDGKFKLSLDSEILRGVNKKTKLRSGAVILSDRDYDLAEGEEFRLDELASLLHTDLTHDQAKKHPVWRVLSRSQSLLDDYVDCFFKGKITEFKRYARSCGPRSDFSYARQYLRCTKGSDVKGMWINLENRADEYPELRFLLFQNWIVGNSGLCGNGNLDFREDMMVGVKKVDVPSNRFSFRGVLRIIGIEVA